MGIDVVGWDDDGVTVGLDVLGRGEVVLMKNFDTAAA